MEQRLNPLPGRTPAARRRRLVGLAVSALLLITATLLVLVRRGQVPGVPPADGVRAMSTAGPVSLFDQVLRRELAKAGVDTTLMRRESLLESTEADGGRIGRERREIPVPREFDRAAGDSLFARAVRRAGGRTPEFPAAPDAPRRARLAEGLEVEVLYLLPEPEEEERPRLALLVADFGYRNLAESEALLQFGRGLTVAIPPFATGARDLADRCRDRGMEVVVNLPMEDVNYPRVDPGPGAVLVDMTEGQIQKRIEEAFHRLGGATGVHTFLGGLAVEDRVVMRTVLTEVGRRRAYFLDSTRSAYSTVPELAAELGVPAMRLRDNLDAREAKVGPVTANLEDLAARARRRGWAVGLVHPYPATVEALRRLLPEWSSQGLEVVPVSAVVRVPSTERGRRSD